MSKLKDIIRKMPDGDELYKILYGLGDPDMRAISSIVTHGFAPQSPRVESSLDRTAAIIGFSYIEYGLKKAIITHFSKTLSNDFKEGLFNDANNGPLVTAAARIRIAYGLGILDDKTYKDLNTLRNIRNAFAHSFEHIQFTDSIIEAECKSLYVLNHPLWINEIPDDTNSRQRYVIAIAIYFRILESYPLPVS